MPRRAPRVVQCHVSNSCALPGRKRPGGGPRPAAAGGPTCGPRGPRRGSGAGGRLQAQAASAHGPAISWLRPQRPSSPPTRRWSAGSWGLAAACRSSSARAARRGRCWRGGCGATAARRRWGAVPSSSGAPERLATATAGRSGRTWPRPMKWAWCAQVRGGRRRAGAGAGGVGCAGGEGAAVHLQPAWPVTHAQHPCTARPAAAPRGTACAACRGVLGPRPPPALPPCPCRRRARAPHHRRAAGGRPHAPGGAAAGKSRRQMGCRGQQKSVGH